MRMPHCLTRAMLRLDIASYCDQVGGGSCSIMLIFSCSCCLGIIYFPIHKANIGRERERECEILSLILILVSFSRISSCTGTDKTVPMIKARCTELIKGCFAASDATNSREFVELFMDRVLPRSDVSETLCIEYAFRTAT
jgi:hypothetical protein